jgi:tripartite-type tricarboxylate transporter receptor subunit TctC
MLRNSAALALLVAATLPAAAQSWPTRPPTMVVPLAAGGASDGLSRVFVPRLGELLGQQVVVENVGGAGGMTALVRLSKAPPDGYLIAIGNSGTHTFSQILYKSPPYNAVTDFTPVSMVTEGGYVLIVRKDLPVDTLPEFISYVRARQAGMQYGSAGGASGTHVICALLNLTIGARVTHVPYRGTSLALQDLMGGRIDYICDAIVTARPQIEGGTVKAIAVLWPERSPVLPQVPTADEQGLKGFDASSWNAIFLPKDTPGAIVQRLSAAIDVALDTPAVRTRMEQLGLKVTPPARRGPENLARFVADEIPRWTRILQTIGISAD